MKKLMKICIFAVILLFTLMLQVEATNSTLKIEQLISKYKNIDMNKISNEEVEAIYDEVLENYTSEELANMIKENKSKLENQGISGETIDKGAEFLKTTDDKQVRELIKGTDIKEVIQRVQDGESIERALVKSQKDFNETVKTGAKIVLSSYVVKTILSILGIYILYKIIIRGIIYYKAGKNFIWTFIPIVRDAILFKICGYSPWIVLLLLIPVIGWIIYLIYKIFMKFELAEKFGHSLAFGFGLWFLNPIFESIIAFSKNKYEAE